MPLAEIFAWSARTYVRANALRGVHNQELTDNAANRPMRCGGQLPLQSPSDRTDHRYDLASGDILVRSAMSQKANAMLATFQVNNIVSG